MGLAEPLSVSQALLSTDNYVSMAVIDTGVYVSDEATPVSMAVIDTGVASSLTYTLKAATNNLHWQVRGGNLADMSDAVVVQSQATVNAAAIGTFTASPAYYRYYDVQIKAASAGNQGTGTV